MEACSLVLSCHQHWNLGIFQHESEAIDRVGGVQRDVGTTCLENAQKAYHHVQGALYAETHERIGSYAKCLQVMS